MKGNRCSYKDKEKSVKRLAGSDSEKASADGAVLPKDSVIKAYSLEQIDPGWQDDQH